MNDADYRRFSEDLSELRRMLTALLMKVESDRVPG